MLGREAALESFLNLGADEIDIRGIKGDFVVHNVKEHIWREVRPSFLENRGVANSVDQRR
jgi:hypothetical protein